MSSPRPVGGLLKGLQVLECLVKVGEASALDLSRLLGIPRPTVSRLLDTLQTGGYVYRSKRHEKWRLAAGMHAMFTSAKVNDWLAELAAPALANLSAEVVWPTDIAAFENNAMIVRSTTHFHSPLSIERVRSGKRISMLTSATGQAYLAFCPGAERDAIVDILLSINPDKNSRSLERQRLVAEVELARRRGYGLRIRGSQPKTSSIAVPIIAGSSVIACINISWIDSALEVDTAISRYLAPLQQAAASVSEAYVRQLANHSISPSG